MWPDRIDFHKTDLDIWSHSRDRKSLFYSQILYIMINRENLLSLLQDQPLPVI